MVKIRRILTTTTIIASCLLSGCANDSKSYIPPDINVANADETMDELSSIEINGHTYVLANEDIFAENIAKDLQLICNWNDDLCCYLIFDTDGIPVISAYTKDNDKQSYVNHLVINNLLTTKSITSVSYCGASCLTTPDDMVKVLGEPTSIVDSEDVYSSKNNIQNQTWVKTSNGQQITYQMIWSSDGKHRAVSQIELNI